MVFLDERKLRILRAVIDEYINTAEPVGSRHLSKNNDIGLSSATIRNEMADLEDMGFLEQPYTSAGRIPSEKGYRIYVDKLMDRKELSQAEINDIRKGLELKINEMNQLIRQAAVVLSDITNYTSIAVSPSAKKSRIKAVQVVPVETGRVLVIVVTHSGIVRNVIVNISVRVTPDYLISLSNYLNERLYNLSLEHINKSLVKEIEMEEGVSSALLSSVFEGILECIAQIDRPEMFLDGTTNIFNFPEFRDIDRAKNFLNTLKEEEKMISMFLNHESNGELNIQIGRENGMDGMDGCSLLTATYSFGDEVIGTVGIIGPTRMDYARVIPAVNFIRKRINKELGNMFGRKYDKD